MRFATALCLSLLLLLPAAALAESATATSEPEVAWDMTVEAMMEAEGVTDVDSVDTYSVGDFVQYGFPREADSENPETYVYYIFKNDQLVMIGHSMDSSAMGEDADVEAVFETMLSTISDEFGEPTLSDAQTFIDQLNALEADTAEPGDVSTFAGWELGYGTELYLMVAPDGSSILYVYSYPSMLLGE